MIELSLEYGAKISRAKNGYTVTFRDLKNVFAEGDNRKEAMLHAQEVLDLLLIEMAKEGMDIPDPSPLHKGEIPIAASPKIAVPILLRKLRRKQHCSMADIAHSMGVSYQNYQQMEAGKNMTLNSLKQASKALDAIPSIKFYVRDERQTPYQIKKIAKKCKKKQIDQT